MNSWQLIRRQMVMDQRPGSVGYLIALKKAALLFMSIRFQLNDYEEAAKSFNLDDELSVALLDPTLSLIEKEI
jgi:hypothetical protein